MSYNKREREDYNMHRSAVCEALNITKNQYNWFRREGEKLHKVYENDCNGLYATEEESDKASRDIVYRINVYKQECEELLYAYFQTDPRGATIYLDRQPIEQSAYTNAYCIY